jgi:hypothetical protein
MVFVLVFLVEGFAIALKMTGLDIEKARFQILSIITGIGFTTKESELIIQHPVRRRIAKVIMIVHFAATASLVTILYKFLTEISNSFSHGKWIYIIIGLSIMTIVLFISRSKRVLGFMDNILEFRILKSMKRNKKRSVEEVIKLDENSGVMEVIISEKSELVGKELKDAELKKNFIQVLNIERPEGMIQFPSKNDVFEVGDRVVVYGKMQNIRKMV